MPAVKQETKLTKVTIIIHEGRGDRGPAGRMGRRHGHPQEHGEGRGEHRHEHHGRHSRHGAGCGHRHEHGDRSLDRPEMGRGRPEEKLEGRGEHHHGRHAAGCGHRHAHGDRSFDRPEMGHGHPEESREGRGHRRYGYHSRHGAGHGHHASGSATDEQRQLARRLRRQMRHILQEAEAAGLSPERVERVVRRESRRSYL